MSELLKADICVIGAGSGGLSIAAGAVQMGASVILIERDKMGGDCLNTGCVPSKALIACAKQAHLMRNGEPFGISCDNVTVDYSKVRAHIKKVIATIEPHDSVERFESLGVTVIKANAEFIDERTVRANKQLIKAKRFVIATGSRAAVPPIPGLAECDYLTNENIFELDSLPSHLIIIGGGPIGCELAQSYRRLGARVSLVEIADILAKDDKALVRVVREQLLIDGVELFEGISIDKVVQTNEGINLEINSATGKQSLKGSHLLVAAGRRPNLENLNLESAGINYTKQGISVDKRLRTSNKRVFAIGDVAGHYQFTHIAGYHAGVVIQNILFRLPSKVNYKAVPWVTYTDPELAHIGADISNLPESQIQQFTFADNDRAQADNATKGALKVGVDNKGRVLGLDIVGPHAGEMLLPWSIAINKGLKLSTIASQIVAYPTLSELSKRLAGSYYTPKLYSEKVKRIVRLLLNLP